MCHRRGNGLIARRNLESVTLKKKTPKNKKTETIPQRKKETRILTFSLKMKTLVSKITRKGGAS